ncbi:hypothetical protein DMI70_06455 [Escherichia coli]|nr:hypothetical protein [Escherichia coli]
MGTYVTNTGLMATYSSRFTHTLLYSALRPHEYNGGLPPNESENDTGKKTEIVTSFAFNH